MVNIPLCLQDSQSNPLCICQTHHLPLFQYSYMFASGGGLLVSFILNFNFIYLVCNVNKVVPSSGGQGTEIP